MKTLVSTFLLLTLLPSVSPITGPKGCWTSLGFGITGCGNITDSACYAKVVDFPMRGVGKNDSVQRIHGCIRRQDCHPRNFTATLPDDLYIYMRVDCCRVDVCNKPLKAPDQKKRPLNGMECPGCLNLYTNVPCSSDNIVSCRGKENNCIAFTGTLKAHLYTYPHMSFKGCATRRLCNLLTGASEEGNDMLNSRSTIEAECSPAQYPDY